ncbi:MAG: hypothetical protein AAGG07_00585 [Planctomycetota bacterium]
MKAPVVMSAYALVMVGGGLVAFTMAPEGANALTALIVPTVAALLMLVCAGASALINRSKPIGMIGIHLGLVLPLVFAFGIGQRAMIATGASGEYRESRASFDAQVEAGEMPTGDEAFIEYLQREKYRAMYEGVDGSPDYVSWLESDDAQDINDYDKGYLAVILWVLTGASLIAFIALLLSRPKPQARGATGNEESGEAPRDSAEEA